MSNRVYFTKDEFTKANDNCRDRLPFDEDISVLKKPLSLGSRLIPNRLACQAMEGCDGNPDGSPGELTKRRYKRFAEGGAGLIWFEATAVMEEGRANPHQLYINENTLDSFKREVNDIKEYGLRKNGYEPIVIMQATHSGRYSKPNGTPAPLIAYNNPLFEKDVPIASDRIVSDEYLDRVLQSLINGASLAESAGFDGVDIKCCHRYLCSELMSAYTRDGRYGGSLENRSRLLREAVEGSVAATGNNFEVATRMNIYDGFPYPYGFGVAKDGSLAFDPDEPVTVIKELLRLGVKLVDLTMGNPYVNPHVNRPYSVGGYLPPEEPINGVYRMLSGTAAVKRSVPGINIVCSALSYLGVAAPNVAAAYINGGGFDIAGFGRQAFAYPDFANDILKNGEMDPGRICLTCSQCTAIMRAGGTPGCAVRDREVYLPIYRKYCVKTDTNRK